MIIKTKAAGISLAALAAAGLGCTACAGGTATADQFVEAPPAEEQIVEEQIVEEQILESGTDEKKVIEKRVVHAFVSDDGKVSRTEKVIILDGGDVDGDVDLEFFGDDDTHEAFKFKHAGDGAFHMSHCTGDADDENPPVKFEWKGESEDGKHMEVSVICLTGDDAAPENQAAALEEAIARLEAQGAADQERPTRAIEAMRSKLEKLKADSE